MYSSKQTKYTLPIKGLGGRAWNIQTIHDAIKKCRSDFRTESNLYMQARQWTTALDECFEEELDTIPSLSSEERKSLLEDVHKYNQRLLEWLKKGKGKKFLDFAEREILGTEYENLVKRLGDLKKSASAISSGKTGETKTTVATLQQKPNFSECQQALPKPALRQAKAQAVQ